MADNLHRQFDHIEDFEIERRQTTNYQDDQEMCIRDRPLLALILVTDS